MVVKRIGELGEPAIHPGVALLEFLDWLALELNA
jgi:hypothetical protein